MKSLKQQSKLAKCIECCFKLAYEKRYGARLSGGGFGGSAVILVHKDNVEAVKTLLEDKFKGTNYELSVVKPSGGATFIHG
jgi:galactokinase